MLIGISREFSLIVQFYEFFFLSFIGLVSLFASSISFLLSAFCGSSWRDLDDS